MLLVFVSSVVVTFNLASLFADLKTRTGHKSFSNVVTFINMNDVNCGVYLATLWIADTIIKGSHKMSEEHWKSGWVCFFAFAIVMWFSIAAELFGFLSLSRLMIVVQPIDTPFKRPNYVFKFTCSLYFVSLVFSFMVTLAVKVNATKLPSRFCSPFVDPSKSVYFIKIMVWSVSVSQFLTSFTVVALHCLLVYHMLQSQQNVGKDRSKDVSNFFLISNLTVCTASYIFSWFSANGAYVSSLYLETYPDKLVVWTTLLALPFNSIVNPCFFLMSLIRKHFKS